MNLTQLKDYIRFENVAVRNNCIFISDNCVVKREGSIYEIFFMKFIQRNPLYMATA